MATESRRSNVGPMLAAMQENDSQASISEHNDLDTNAKRLSGVRARLTAFFWAHDPRRVEKVDDILQLNQGREEEYLQRLHMEFGVRDFSGEAAVDDIYEHERYSYLSFSWGSSFPGHLLPTDRRRWSGLHGTSSSQKRAKVEPQLPVNWQWTSEWEVDKSSTNCDGDGWIYAFDFTMLNFMVKRNGGRKEPKSTDYVRRRRWIRRRVRAALEPIAVNEPQSRASESNDDNTNQSEDLVIPDSLDVDDDEGEDPGDDEDEDGQGGDAFDEMTEETDLASLSASTQTTSSKRPTPLSLPPLVSSSSSTKSARAKTGATTRGPSNPTLSGVRTASLEHYSLPMEKPAVDAAWSMAVKNLEAIYASAKSHQMLKKKRWTVKKEKIQQQINLLEKTIASMQLFVQEEQLKRRHSSSNLNRQQLPSKGLHKTQTRFPLSPGPTTRNNPGGTSRVSSSDTTGINLASKLKCAQSKLDALKRMFWHPREKNYTLRFSIDGIFYGLRDFFVETFKSSFAIHMSHQSNGAQGITPTCKIVLKGHTVCCGKHVKVIGEKGTIVPKSLWDMMYLDSDFEATIYLIYVEDVDDERNPWLADKPTGKWEFLFTRDSTRVELSNFNRRTKGGLDLPEPVVRKLMSDVLSGLIRDLALLYFPQELAMAFESPPAKLDMEGEIEITGPPIDDVVEREIELTAGVVIKPPVPPGIGIPSSANGGVGPSTPPPGSQPIVDSLSPPGPPASPKSPRSPTMAAAAAPFVAVAAAASATVNMLIGSDTDQCMRKVAELLELSPAQLNLFVALRQCGLYPAPYTFRSVATLFTYYNTFFNQEREEGSDHVQQLRTTWKQLLELVYIRKMKAHGEKSNSATSKYELFDMDKLFDRIDHLVKKPAKLQISVNRFHCTVNAMSVVEAMALMYERVVLGIDYSKPRSSNDQLIYGFRFGRKPKVSAAAALAAHTQSAQLLDPTIHLQMDASFRSRLKAFSKFCRGLKGAIELVRMNLDNVSLEVTGKVKGTGQDCAISGSFRDLVFAGPVNISLHVPALFLGIYRVQTIPLGGDRIGLQIELLMPSPTKTNRKSHKSRDQVLLRAMLTDFSMEVLLDIDALIDQHHRRSLSSATEMTAPWSPSPSFTRKVETEKTHEKHSALSVAVQSTTAANGLESEDEHIIRVPSPTAHPGQAYGKIRVESSEFTKLHVRAKTGSFSTQLMPLLRLLIDYVRPFFMASFPEHPVLFDRLHSCLLRWLCAPGMQMDFDLMIKGFLHEKDKLFFTTCGSPANPKPILYEDEINLLDVILQADDLVNIWIDDRYPPYSNPLYF